jgi:hypothetical protein
MKYACLVYVDETLIEALPEEVLAGLDGTTLEFDRRLAAEGRLSFAQPLQPPKTAITVRVRDGRLSRTDGPFAETKEHLAGLFVVEAANIEEAVALAETSPMAALGSIEVRAFGERG